MVPSDKKVCTKKVAGYGVIALERLLSAFFNMFHVFF